MIKKVYLSGRIEFRKNWLGTLVPYVEECIATILEPDVDAPDFQMTVSCYMRKMTVSDYSILKTIKCRLI